MCVSFHAWAAAASPARLRPPPCLRPPLCLPPQHTPPHLARLPAHSMWSTAQRCAPSSHRHRLMMSCWYSGGMKAEMMRSSWEGWGRRNGERAVGPQVGKQHGLDAPEQCHLLPTVALPSRSTASPPTTPHPPSASSAHSAAGCPPAAAHAPPGTRPPAPPPAAALSQWRRPRAAGGPTWQQSPPAQGTQGGEVRWA